MMPPGTSVNLTDRDREVLGVLALRIRTMSVAQVARTWWTSSANAVRGCQTRMGELAATGLLGTANLMAHPEQPMNAPLVVWQPGLDCPDLASTAHRARSRWTAPGVATEFVFATREAAHLIGGEPGRAPRPSEATHDLHLAAVYLLMRHELPTRTRSWRSEVLALADRSLRRPAPGDKMPDALVRDGRSRTAIEFVGEYTVEKLNAFHHYCVRARLGYELW